MSVSLAQAIQVPADFESMARVRSELVDLLERQGWPEEARQRILLAGCEAVTNAIEHGSDSTDTVRVEFEVNGKIARLAVADRGRDGSSVPSLDVEPPPPTAIRGRGLVIMRSMSDRATVSPSGDGTLVVLEFDREG